MQKDLLGYLLGALEPHEMLRVAELLRSDPIAQAELERIEQSFATFGGGLSGCCVASG